MLLVFEAKTTALSPLQEGQGCHLLSSFADARARTALCSLQEGRDRLDLPLPHPHPHAVPQECQGPDLGSAVQCWVEAKTADSTGCLGPRPGRPCSACYPVLPAINTIPSLLTVWLRPHRSKQTVTTQSVYKCLDVQAVM